MRGPADLLVLDHHGAGVEPVQGLLDYLHRLTDLAEPARTDALMKALKALVPRHLPIVAAPHAAEIERLAMAPAREWRDPSIAIAAREQRQRALAQVLALRQHGVVVLDEADDQLDRAVLESYLQLRSRRRV